MRSQLWWSIFGSMWIFRSIMRLTLICGFFLTITSVHQIHGFDFLIPHPIFFLNRNKDQFIQVPFLALSIIGGFQLTILSQQWIEHDMTTNESGIGISSPFSLVAMSISFIMYSHTLPFSSYFNVVKEFIRFLVSAFPDFLYFSPTAFRNSLAFSLSGIPPLTVSDMVLSIMRTAIRFALSHFSNFALWAAVLVSVNAAGPSSLRAKSKSLRQEQSQCFVSISWSWFQPTVL